MSDKHRNWEKFVIGERRPIRIFVGFTADDSAWFSRQIQRATDGVWGHMLVGFQLDDGSACYFEALLGDGVTGPWPIERLLTWEREPSHRAAIVFLPDTLHEEGDPVRALDRALSAVGRQSYSAPQLLAMGLSERYGFPVWRTEHRTVCSEFVAWVLLGILDLCDRRRRIIDQLTPNSAWRRLMECLAGYGRFTSPAGTAPSAALNEASRMAQEPPESDPSPEPGSGESAGMQRISGDMQRGCAAEEEKRK